MTFLIVVLCSMSGCVEKEIELPNVGIMVCQLTAQSVLAGARDAGVVPKGHEIAGWRCKQGEKA